MGLICVKHILLIFFLTKLSKLQQIHHSPLGRGSLSRCIPTYQVKDNISASSFFKNYILQNKPVIIRSSLRLKDDKKWSDDFLSSRLTGEKDYVWWFSGGTTKSLLHYDNVENLYCQVDGHKRWLLADHQENDILVEDRIGHYSKVDVTSVNLTKYEYLEDVRWIDVVTNPGDCIYIPLNWWHQVNSFPGRNMAVNIWWAPALATHTTASCTKSKHGKKQVYLGEVGLVPGEWFRYILASLVKKYKDERISLDQLTRAIVHEHTDELILADGGHLLDADGDGWVSLGEVVAADPGLIHQAVGFSEIGAAVILEEQSSIMRVQKDRLS